MIELDLTDFEARIRRLEPNEDPATPLTLEDVMRVLEFHGICFGILESEIRGAVDRVNKSRRPLVGVVIARGIEPEAARSTAEEMHVQLGQLVAPGDVLISRSQRGEVGRTITGKEVWRKTQRPPPTLITGNNTRFDTDRTRVLASVYGRFAMDRERPTVAPPVSIAEDEMSATIDIHATAASGKQVTLEMLVEALQAEGVKCGIDVEILSHGLENVIASGECLESFPAAAGIPPEAPRPRATVFKFKVAGCDPDQLDRRSREQKEKRGELLLELAVQGSTLCTVEAASSARKGRTVRGKPIIPRRASTAEPRAKPIRCGENVSFDRATGICECVVPVCGYVDFIDQELSVQSPLVTDKDGTSACLTVYPPDRKGRMLERQDVEALLAASHVVHGVDWDAVLLALQKAREQRTIVRGATIAKATPPAHGQNGRLEFLVQTELGVGREMDGGRVDFSERDGIINVKRGEVVCRVQAPTQGIDGSTIFGRGIPAKAGRVANFRPGNNVVEAAEAGGFSATIDGIVMIVDDTVHVLDVAVIDGDVSLATGHIHATEAAVHVKETVMSGFHVESGKHLIVDRTVENTVIESDGDVTVGGGIIHGEKGILRSIRTVKAAFAQNAQIEAGGDIVIRDYAMNCRLTARGRVIVHGGKGCLVGGITMAGRGVAVSELGARSGVRTQVVLRAAAFEMEQVNSELRKLHLLLRAAEDPAAQAEHRDEIAQLLQQKWRLVKQARSDNAGEVAVGAYVYPGVRVTIRQACFEFTETFGRCKIRFDAEQGKVVVWVL
jgi:uncharacterized protein (DUF342 family)